MIRSIGILLISCFILTGCKKDSIVDDIEYSETMFEYAGQVSMVYDVPLTIGLDIPWFPITIDNNSSGGADDPLIKVIENIRLKSMSITITDPAQETFYFLKDLVIYISKDSLPELELAHHYNVSEPIGNVLFMQPSNNSVLDQYVKSGDYDLRLKITTSNVLPTSFSKITFVADLNYNVTLINEQ